MKELIKMVIVLTIISTCSGGILAAVRNGTKDTIKRVVLEQEKAPAIGKILKGVANKPLDDTFMLGEGKEAIDFFVGKFEGGKKAVVFESSGNGFEAAIGVMVGVNLDDDKIIGIGVTTHSETPGIGSKAKTDTFLPAQFTGIDLTGEFKVKKDGGKIDAISGATITSRGVCLAVTNASNTYKRLKAEIEKNIK
jgi:electron transport complex protein RnfG